MEMSESLRRNAGVLQGCVDPAIFAGRALMAYIFQKKLAIAGGFLILAALGPGAWSLDGWLARIRA